MVLTCLLSVLFVWCLLSFLTSFPLSFPRQKLHASRLSVYYGGPGSGKTTFAAWLTARYLCSGIPVYSNVPIKGAYIIRKEDIGRWNIPFGLLIIDEAGIEYNNRDFGDSFSKKSGGSAALEWYKKHRHELVEVAIFSQGFEDMDKKLRELASDLYIVRPSLIPFFTVRKRIRKRPNIDDNTHQPIDYYDFQPFSTKRIFGPSVWKSFDSFDRMNLPAKGWLFYGGFPDALPRPSLRRLFSFQSLTERSEAAEASTGTVDKRLYS